MSANSGPEMRQNVMAENGMAERKEAQDLTARKQIENYARYFGGYRDEQNLVSDFTYLRSSKGVDTCPTARWLAPASAEVNTRP